MSFTQDIPEAEIKAGEINFFRLANRFDPFGNESGAAPYAAQINEIEALGYILVSTHLNPVGFQHWTVVARATERGSY